MHKVSNQYNVFEDTTTGYLLRLLFSNIDKLQIATDSGGGWVVLVETAALVFNNKQKMRIIIDPEEGSLEVIGAISGGDKVVDTSWNDFISDDSEMYFGMNHVFDNHVFALLAQIAIYEE